MSNRHQINPQVVTQPSNSSSSSSSSSVAMSPLLYDTDLLACQMTLKMHAQQRNYVK